MPAKILLIDDDESLLKLLGRYLSDAGYAVTTADNGASGLQQLYQEQPNLVVLDVMMPSLDGWETCRRIRDMTDVPIIMLTVKGEEPDKLKAFRLGVDDYVTKPFSFAELAARVGAVLQRVGQADVQGQESRLQVGDLILDRQARVASRGGETIDLTPTEFKLLTTLMEHAGEVISPENLVTAVWGEDYADATGYVRRYIWHLRQKIEPDPAKPKYIFNERGFGYRFRAG
ncbi:MAG: Transcriptional regulatory protein WalR [Anaerolineales bacterium]|nr:Transcriptional regulatory protein WalR [Anaerolineales bacterium]